MNEQSSPSQATPAAFDAAPAPVSGSILPLVAKALLGLVAILLVVLGAFRFLPPLFSPKQDKVTITYWGLHHNDATIRSIVAGFEKQYPTIALSYKKQETKQYQERVLTRIANGTGPDVFEFHNTWLPVFLSVLVPLPTDVMQTSDFSASFYPIAEMDLIKQGAIYGIPLSIDTLGLFVNTEIFEAAGVEVPTTWNEFGNTARVLTVKDETGKIQTSGAAMGTFDNITHAPEILSLLFIQNGANVSDIGKTAQNVSDALTFYTQFATTSDNVWDETMEPSLTLFAKGNLAMYFGFASDVEQLRQIDQNLRFAVHKVPHLPGRSATIGRYVTAGASLRSKHIKEALLFLSYLAKTNAAPVGIPPARVDLSKSFLKDAVLGPLVEQAPEALPSYFVSDASDSNINESLNAYLRNAVVAILSGNSAESTIAALDQGVKQVLGQYEAK